MRCCSENCVNLVTPFTFKEVPPHSACTLEVTYDTLNCGASKQHSFNFFVFKVLPFMRYLDWTFYSVTSISLVNVGAFNLFFAQETHTIPLEIIFARTTNGCF
jgi:hypothetical protein